MLPCVTSSYICVLISTSPVGDCEQPPSILNGVVVAPILKFTFNATYTCNTGYHLVGVAVIFCVDDASGDNRGVWDRGAPSCVCKQLQ